jgi:hypothetical protein
MLLLVGYEQPTNDLCMTPKSTLRPDGLHKHNHRHTTRAKHTRITLEPQLPGHWNDQGIKTFLVLFDHSFPAVKPPNSHQDPEQGSAFRTYGRR